MTNDDGRKPEGAPERSPKAGAGAPSGVDGNGPKRFSVQRKMAIVARLLRGEPLELVARETNVSIARLTEADCSPHCGGIRAWGSRPWLSPRGRHRLLAPQQCAPIPRHRDHVSSLASLLWLTRPRSAACHSRGGQGF